MRTLQARNPHLVRLGRLSRRRKAREEEGAFVVDGPVLLGEALDAELRCLEVFVDPERIDRSIEGLIDRAEAAGAEVFGVDNGSMRRLTDPATPQALAAIVGRPDQSADVLRSAATALVLAEVADPGNAGTLVRAAAAAGIEVVVATAGTVDLFAPKTVRASAGAVLHVPTCATGTASETFDVLADAGLRTVAAVVDQGVPYDQADLTARTAIVVGNEAHGLDRTVVEQADVAVRIPMAGPVESLNVAMAGTLLCFEVLRQRRNAGTDPAGLDARTDGRV